MYQSTRGKMTVSGASLTEFGRLAYYSNPLHTHIGWDSNYRDSKRWMKRQAHKADRRQVKKDLSTE